MSEDLLKIRSGKFKADQSDDRGKLAAIHSYMRPSALSVFGRSEFQSTARFVLSRLYVTSSATQNATQQQHAVTPRPFHEIPGPRSLPIVKSIWAFFPYVALFVFIFRHRNLLKQTGFLDMSRVETCYTKLQAIYGNMVKMEIPGEKSPFVMTFDPELFRQIFAMEGTFPERPGLRCLKKYRESRPDLYTNLGLFFESGQTWKDMRSSAQKHMMRTPAIRVYLPAMEKVSTDFVERIRSARGTNMEVDNFLNELFKWALESIGIVALNRRLGCLEHHLSADSEPQRLIDAVQTSFQVIHVLEMGAGIERFFPGKLTKKLFEAQDYFAMVTHKYLNRAVEEMKARGPLQEEELNLIETFIASKEMTLKEVAVIVGDFFFAGIDTTSVATVFLLYQLATNPDKQERLLKEIRSVLPNNDTPITTEALESMSYLRACVRESMRLTPVTIGTARIAPNDTVLGGYHIPAGTNLGAMGILIGRDESKFPQATKFLPERWLRAQDPGASKERQDAGFTPEYVALPYGTIPFGHGPRMCIGRRIAEQELNLGVIKVVQNFRLDYQHPEKIDVQISALNRPSGEFRIQFHDRK